MVLTRSANVRKTDQALISNVQFKVPYRTCLGCLANALFNDCCSVVKGGGKLSQDS